MIRAFRLQFGDKPFMTGPERGEFRRMVKTGEASVFDIAFCAAVGCEEEVPKSAKVYCSEQCFNREEGRDEEEQAEEEGWGLD